MEELKLICRKYKVLLIEDAAQAMGGVDHKGNVMGKIGDIAILSFGHTKILDVGDGGALLTDNDGFADFAHRLVQNLPDKPENYSWLSSTYQKLYYTIWEAGKYAPSFYHIFDSFPELFRSLYLYRATDEMALNISDAMKGLQEEINHRRQISDIYHQGLKNCKNVKFFRPTGPGIPWRYSFRMEAPIREQVLYELRDQGFDASCWYPCITGWNPHGRMQDNDGCLTAKKIEREIVNLWVTGDYTIEKAHNLVKCLRKALDDQIDG
jgi:dTDP-4-amino-4,6-dideoxygalactose transaminase